MNKQMLSRSSEKKTHTIAFLTTRKLTIRVCFGHFQKTPPFLYFFCLQCYTCIRIHRSNFKRKAVIWIENVCSSSSPYLLNQFLAIIFEKNTLEEAIIEILTKLTEFLARKAVAELTIIHLDRKTIQHCMYHSWELKQLFLLLISMIKLEFHWFHLQQHTYL